MVIDIRSQRNGVGTKGIRTLPLNTFPYTS